jgi:O-antigen/teichoic acid export membrane protein
MTIFACFGPMFSTQYLMIILGIVFGIEFILAGGIALVISKVLRIRRQKIIRAGAITLLVSSAISVPMGSEVTTALTLLGAIACGGLLALGWLISLINQPDQRRAEG